MMSRGSLLLVLLAAACNPPPPSAQTGPSAADLRTAREVLADRNQPWWNGHAVRSPGEELKIKGADTGDWASMNYFPPGTPVLPLAVARAVHAQADVVKGSPFADRLVTFLDIRPESDFYVEHIPASRNVPVKHLEQIPSSIDRKSILVVLGRNYPHHEVIARLRTAGFTEVYCLEGGLHSWKGSGYPLEGRTDVQEYRNILEKEREPNLAAGPSPDFMGLGPLALKALIDARAEMMIVFVGDESTYASGHIPGAVRAELGKLEPAFKDVPKDKLVAVYCGCCAGRAGGYSEAEARELRRL